MKLLFSFVCLSLWHVVTTASNTTRRLGWWHGNDDDDDDEACPIVTTVSELDLDAYASAPWYVHEQAVTTYLPAENNFCVTARYTPLERRTFWGYTIRVDNRAKNPANEEEDVGGILYAVQDSHEPGRLKVAPGVLPPFLAGPYWILDYAESTTDREGHALVIGGQPSVRTENGCRTRNRWITSSGGLWIFTRSPVRNDELVERLRNRLATEFGLDVTVLNPVDHSDAELCGYNAGD